MGRHSRLNLNFEPLEVHEVRSCASSINLMPISILLSLEMGCCEELKNLFTSRMAESLVRLEKLEV